MSLPTDAQARKSIPIYSGVLMYFPDAIAEVARISKLGNDQHNPGQPLHWAKHKSQDQLDCVARHLLNAGDDITHAANMAWRSLANLQILIEARSAGMTVEAYNKKLRDEADKPMTATEMKARISEMGAEVVVDDLSKLVRWDKPQPDEPGDDAGNRAVNTKVIIQHLGEEHFEGAPCAKCDNRGRAALRGPGGV